MNRRLFPAVLGLVAAAFVAAVGAHPGVAPPSARAAGPHPAAPPPNPAATATPAAAPSPTASPEPLDKAIPRLEAKLKTDPNDKQRLTALSADYLQINRPDLAIKLTQKLLQSGTKTAQVYYFDGLAQGGTGHPKEA